MPAPSVTYTFSNSTTADASQVNQNFSDLINGITDGTKDLSISALTCAGTLTANGHVNLGNAVGDDLTITASLASNLVPKTDATYALGSSSIGYSGLYLGRNSQRVRLIPSASTSASYDLTLPTATGTNGHAVATTGSGTLVWGPAQWDINAVSAGYTVTDTDGYSLIAVTTGASNRTITLPTAADNTDRVILIKKVDSGNGAVIVDGEGAETIDGVATVTLFKPYESLKIKCDGTSWHIISANWASGTSSLTVTNINDFTSISSNTALYTRISKDMVRVDGDFGATNTDSTRHRASIALPIASTFSTNQDGAGVCAFNNGAAADTLRSQGGIIGVDTAVSTSEVLLIIFPGATSAAGTVKYSFTYLIR